MMSPPSVTLRPLMLVVLAHPNIPAFLAGLKLATEITKKPLSSARLIAFAMFGVTSAPAAPSHGCKKYPLLSNEGIILIKELDGMAKEMSESLKLLVADE